MDKVLDKLDELIVLTRTNTEQVSQITALLKKIRELDNEKCRDCDLRNLTIDDIVAMLQARSVRTNVSTNSNA